MAPWRDGAGAPQTSGCSGGRRWSRTRAQSSQEGGWRGGRERCSCAELPCVSAPPWPARAPGGRGGTTSERDFPESRLRWRRRGFRWRVWPSLPGARKDPITANLRTRRVVSHGAPRLLSLNCCFSNREVDALDPAPRFPCLLSLHVPECHVRSCGSIGKTR